MRRADERWSFTRGELVGELTVFFVGSSTSGRAAGAGRPGASSTVV